MTINDKYVLAVRCIEKELSIGIMNRDLERQRFKAGAEFEIKFRTDRGSIYECSGTAINDRLIQVPTPTLAFLNEMRKGKETAVRIEDEDGSARVDVFRLKKTPQTLERILKECKAE